MLSAVRRADRLAPVGTVDGQLSTVSFPTSNPRLTKLRHMGEHTFRRIRDDGGLAEAFTFEVDADGQVTRMVRNSNYSIRVR